MTRGRTLFAALVALVAGYLFSVQPGTAASSRTASDETANCYKMMVLRVVDGDTIYGYIDTSDPLIAIRARLRLRGIDTPERGKRALCDGERVQGEAAKEYVQSLLSDAIAARTRSLVRACDLKRGKYALRRIGHLQVRRNNGWVDISEQLLRAGLARPSKGRRDKWCAADGTLLPPARRPRASTNQQSTSPPRAQAQRVAKR